MKTRTLKYISTEYRDGIRDWKPDLDLTRQTHNLPSSPVLLGLVKGYIIDTRDNYSSTHKSALCYAPKAIEQEGPRCINEKH